jgi:hypothetical protein
MENNTAGGQEKGEPGLENLGSTHRYKLYVSKPSTQHPQNTMTISIQVPEEVARRLKDGWKDLPARALEALVVEAYRDELLTAAEVGSLLGHASRYETEAFLSRRQAYMVSDPSEILADRERMREVQRS